MFGLIVAGRLVSTNWEQISPTNLVSEITDAEAVNHLVVFLTGIFLLLQLTSPLNGSHVQGRSRSLTVWAVQCISVGLHRREENKSGNCWELSTTTNLQQYSGWTVKYIKH